MAGKSAGRGQTMVSPPSGSRSTGLLQLQSLRGRAEARIGPHPVPPHVDLDERRLEPRRSSAGRPSAAAADVAGGGTGARARGLSFAAYALYGGGDTIEIELIADFPDWARSSLLNRRSRGVVIIPRLRRPLELDSGRRQTPVRNPRG